MNVFLVYAHQDPTSFGTAMHNRALSFFEKRGDKTVISDLYGTGFHPVAAKWDFKTSGGVGKNYMQEQQRVAQNDNGALFSEDIKQEITRIREANLLVFEFPLWWSAPPAIMKGWFDKVFALGITWDGDHRYQNGLLKGKQVLVITGAGDSDENYSAEGIHRATITQHLYPLLHSTLAHAGLDVLKPFIATGLTAADDSDRQTKLAELDQYLNDMVKSPKYLYKNSG